MSKKLIPPDPEQIKAMDPEELLKMYKGLLWKIANRYAPTASKYAWIDADDLYQIASLALLKAQEQFDPKGEFTFMTVAFNQMKWDIFRALKIRWNPDGSIKVEPVPLSLDEPVSKDGDDTRGELIPGNDPPLDELMEIDEVVSRVWAAVRSLPKDQEDIIRKIYLDDPGQTRKEIAEEKGTTGQSIANTERKAFKDLRRKLQDYEEFRPRHIGLREFNTLWMTEQEQYVLTREKQLEQLESRYRAFIRQTTGRDIDL